jgi:hypothetical protein
MTNDTHQDLHPESVSHALDGIFCFIEHTCSPKIKGNPEMSYDLYFWRQTDDTQMRPGEVMNILSKDEPVYGIAAFPRDHVRRVLKEYFPDIQDGDFELTWEGAGSYFEMSFSHANEKDVHLIVVNCGYELLKSPEAMNRLIDACTSLGCALYDPQVDKRFSQPEPKEKS